MKTSKIILILTLLLTTVTGYATSIAVDDTITEMKFYKSIGEALPMGEDVHKILLFETQETFAFDSIASFKNLEELIIVRQDLKHIPEKFQRLKKLKKLTIINCPLKKIPDWLFSLPNLEVVQLCQLPIDELVFDAGQAPKLKELRLTYLNLKKFVISPQSRLSLDILYIAGPGIFTKEQFSNILYFNRNLKELHMFECGLSEIPKEVFALNSLRFFEFQNNELLDVPDELKSLTNMERIDLSFNKLTQFPDVVTEFPRLKHLRIAGNRITTIPAMLFLKCPDIETLNFSCDSLLTIPVEIARLQKLRELDLRFNYLRDIPKQVTGITTLEKLYFGCNVLMKLPTGFPGMNRLQYLDISKNLLTTIPDELRGIRNLKELKIDGNEFPPKMLEDFVSIIGTRFTLLY